MHASTLKGAIWEENLPGPADDGFAAHPAQCGSEPSVARLEELPMTVSPSVLSRCLPALALAALALGVWTDAALAETSVFKLGTLYQCPAAKSFKVLSCSGSADADLCDVQSYDHGQPEMRGKSTHQQVIAVLSICHIQTPGESRADQHPGGTRGDGTNGIKVGDAVEVVTGSGWTRAKVVAVNGNSYRVLVYGVQVNVGGRWISSRIVTEMGQDYQVELPGNRTAWATPSSLRPAHSAPAAVSSSSGVPPKPGLTSCAGKLEGRYATTGGLGSFTLTLRSGKATMTDAGGNDEVFECWMGGPKMYLHKPDAPNLDMPIDINDDGTLQTPLGELRKKAS